MWVFLNDAFLSIVEYKPDAKGKAFADALLVRARSKGDINNVFPRAQVHKTPRNDYGFRAVVDRDEVAAALARRVQQINYPNFKNSVKAKRRASFYMQVWTTCFDFFAPRMKTKARDFPLNYGAPVDVAEWDRDDADWPPRNRV